MKKVFALMLISTLGFGLVSCSSDDDGDSGPNYSVVGKWNITSYTINGESFEDCSLNGIRQFKTDGTYLQDEYVENEQTGICEETLDSPLIGTWQKSNNNLKTSVSGINKTYALEFVNESKFILTETYNNVDFIYTYSKIN